MKLKQLASNMTELHLDNGTIVLFSYETPVASFSRNKLAHGQFQVTKIKYSKTTTKHINKWVDNLATIEVDQSVLDNLVSGV